MSGTGSVLGSVFAGIINSISILILDKLFKPVAVELTHWKKYHHKETFQKAVILKTFVFSFVNSYSSLFYLAFVKGGNYALPGDDVCYDLSGNVTEGSCMDELSLQLGTIIMVRLTWGKLAELFGKDFAMFWQANKHKLTFWQTPATEPFTVEELQEINAGMRDIELQYLDPSYGTDYLGGTFDEYCELAIQYGYMILFSAAVPWATFLGLISNLFETMIDARTVLLERRRPAPSQSDGIGLWLDIFRFLSVLAVATNTMMIALTSTAVEKLINDNIEDFIDVTTSATNGMYFFYLHFKT